MTGGEHPFSPWVCVFSDVNHQPIAEARLVLSAVGIECAVAQVDGAWCLFAPPARSQAARQQLERYRLENLPRRGATPMVVFDNGWPGVLGCLLVLWMLPALEAWGLFDANLREAGRLDVGQVMQGEWHRVVTALTLHADLAHLIGNSLFGAVFGLLLGRYFGSGFGWLLALGCGILGNAMNVALRPEHFLALGASTAMFASVGLIGAFAWRRGYFRGRGLRRGAAPLFGGFALLTFLGLGGINADVLGHVAGFCCGVVVGGAVARFDIRMLGRSGQWLAGALAMATVALSWTAAL